MLNYNQDIYNGLLLVIKGNMTYIAVICGFTTVR